MSYRGEGTEDQGWDGSWRGRPWPGTGIQTISGSGTWNGVADTIHVTGSGARTITLISVAKAPYSITVIDLDGTAGAGNIQINAGSANIEGSASYSLAADFASVTLTKNNKGPAGTWIVLSQTGSDHGSLAGLANDDHTQYILADGTRAFIGDVCIGALNQPSAGYLRVSRRGLTDFDILTTTLNDNTTLRPLISASKDSFRYHTSSFSPMVIWSSAPDSPLRYTSGGNSVDSGIRGATHNIFAIHSVNAAVVSTHQYGPTATAGNALNLSYRAKPVTTVVGIGVTNATDTTKLLVQGLNTNGSTYIYRGTNSSASTVFSVDDLGRTVVGAAAQGAHAVNRDYIDWVPTASSAHTTLASLGPGRVNFHVADVSGGPHTVDLAASPAAGDRVVVKASGDAGANTLTVSGNGNHIDGEPTWDITTNYGSVHLYFNGTEWLTV